MVDSEIKSLDTLIELDSSLLYVFVAGPGVGEAIAVALPECGWLMLDGCRTGARFPLEAIFERWRRNNDLLYAFLLTHPHSDHCDGVPQLIETLDPQQIGITATAPPSKALLFETITHSREAKATSERLLADAVRAAIIAIERWCEDHSSNLLLLHDGVAIPLGPSSVFAHVRAPDRAGLERFLTDPGLRTRLRRNANHISAVVELCFGDARIVLGGDLPRYWPASTRSIETGWDQVLVTHGYIGNHAVLKIPHHGSREAQHPDLMTKGDTTRVWCITPYNSSRLPRLASGDGIPLLLERAPSVFLTAVPAAKAVQAQQPESGRIHLAQLHTRTELQRTGDPFLDAGFDIRPGTACGPLDAVWCLAVDSSGAIRGRWRGKASLEVLRDPVSV